MKILLVGTGGYASTYVEYLLNQASVVWEGIVDPFFANCKQKDEIIKKNIPVYDTMEEFYSKHTADLAIICTPTFLHREQSIFAVSHGSDVLCEKPAAPTVADTEKMLEAEKKYCHYIAIGYQWSYAKEIQDLKADILNGVLGKAISFKTIVSWPRNKDYYNRGGGWGGCIKRNGNLVLDSIASNACAHYLHNMLFVSGDTMDTSAAIKELTAECYRANNIENFDTCSIKARTANDTELYFIASHATDTFKNPEFIYTFENGRVIYDGSGDSEIIAEFNDGSKKVYGNPNIDFYKKLNDCIYATENKARPVCTVKTATPHVSIIEEMYKTVPVQSFSKEVIKDENSAISVNNLFEYMMDAYKNASLLSEVFPHNYA